MILFRGLAFLFFVCFCNVHESYPVEKHNLMFSDRFHVIVIIPKMFRHKEDSILQSVHDSFVQLRQNQIGRILLERIGVLFRERFPEKDKIEIHIDYSEEGKHSFMLPKREKDPLVVKLNYNNLSGARVGTIGKLIRMENGRECYQIGSMHEPFHIILGHELIHLLHYLELGREHYKVRLERPGINIHKNGLYSLRIIDIWKNLEERKTVIGEPPFNHHQITENNLLREERRLPRYAYQSAGENFYEKKEVIESFYPDERLKYLRAENWEFDPDTAKESRKSQEARCIVSDQTSAAAGNLNVVSPQKVRELPLRLRRRLYTGDTK